jgi:hypothetical protein
VHEITLAKIFKNISKLTVFDVESRKDLSSVRCLSMFKKATAYTWRQLLKSLSWF